VNNEMLSGLKFGSGISVRGDVYGGFGATSKAA
jgi:hypothetical protein